LCDVAEMAIFLRPVFSASRVLQVSDLHSKFALRPLHVWKFDRHPISLTAEIRRGKKEERRWKKPQGRTKYNGLPYYTRRPLLAKRTQNRLT